MLEIMVWVQHGKANIMWLQKQQMKNPDNSTCVPRVRPGHHVSTLLAQQPYYFHMPCSCSHMEGGLPYHILNVNINLPLCQK